MADQPPPGGKGQQPPPGGKDQRYPVEDVEMAVAWLDHMTATLKVKKALGVRDEIIRLLAEFGKGRGDPRPQALETRVEALLQGHRHLLRRFGVLVRVLGAREHFAAVEVLAETAQQPGYLMLTAALKDWRGLAAAAAVPGTYATVALDTARLVDTVKSAHTKLGTVVQTLRMRVLGAELSDIRDAELGEFGGAALDGALRELARLDALHAGTGYAYKLYARRSALVAADDLEVQDPLYESWQVHSRDAVLRARDAKRKLRAAASRARAAEDAFRVFQSFPRGCPGRADWKASAVELAQHARVSAALAWCALCRMRDSVALVFYDAWRAVNGAHQH